MLSRATHCAPMGRSANRRFPLGGMTGRCSPNPVSLPPSGILRWPPHRRRRDNRAMHLHVREWGSGPRTALLVHGLFSDSESWHRAGADLAARGYHVLAPDLRGHGLSARGRYEPSDWGLDLVDTFLDRDIDLAIGHSLGGLALAVANHALRPRASIYLDPAWRMDSQMSARFLREWSSWLQWEDKADLASTLGQRWAAEDVDLRWASMWQADPAVVPGLAVSVGYDYSPESAEQPALVLAADPSQYITAQHAADLTARGLRVETVPGSGHSWFRENPSAFLDRVLDWIESTT